MSYSPEKELSIVNTMLKDPNHKTNLRELLYSIRTHKNFEALNLLLQHPVYNINRQAQNVAKLFKKQLIPKEQKQEAGMQLAGDRFIDYCMENNVKELYLNFHAIEPKDFELPKLLRNKKELLSEEIYNQFVLDCQEFNSNIEETINGGEASKQSIRLVKYIEFLRKVFESQKNLTIKQKEELKDFEEQYRKIELEDEYPSDHNIPLQTVIQTFHLESKGLILMENLSFNDTRLARLLAVGELDHFIIDDYSEYELEQKITKRLQEVDTLKHYDLTKLDRRLCTDILKMFYSYWKSDKNVKETYYALSRFEATLHKGLLLEASLFQIVEIREQRRLALKDGRTVNVLKNPEDILLSEWSGEEIKKIPYINVEQGISFVEHALFNQESRFFNNESRYTALRTYLISGFVLQQEQLIINSFNYFTKVYSETSSASEREQLQKCLDVQRFFLLLTNFVTENNLSFTTIMPQFEKSLILLFDSGNYYANTINEIVTIMLGLSMTQSCFITFTAGNALDLIQWLTELSVKYEKLVYSYKIELSALAYGEYMENLCKYEVQDDGVIVVAKRTNQLEPEKCENYKDMLPKEQSYLCSLFNSLFALRKREIELSTLEEQSKQEITELDIISQILKKYNEYNFDEKIAKQMKNVNFELGSFINEVARAITGSIWVYSAEGSEPSTYNINYPEEIVAVVQYIKMLQMYVQQIFDIYQEKNLHYKVENFEGFHLQIIDLLKSIISSYKYENHDIIVEQIKVLSETLEKFAFLKYDLTCVYEKYYESIFERKTRKQNNKDAKQCTALSSQEFGHLKREFVNLKNKIPASKLLQIFSSMMEYEKFSPFVINNIMELQRQIAIDKNADLTILHNNSMPMSSLKLLIKFQFENTKLTYDYIENLFVHSSIDGKNTILLCMYESAHEDAEMKSLFMQLVVKASKIAQDACLLFFGAVYTNEEYLDFNKEIFNAIIEHMIVKPSGYLINFAGFLGIKLDLPLNVLTDLFLKLYASEKEAEYIVLYMLQVQGTIDSVKEALKSRAEQKKRSSPIQEDKSPFSQVLYNEEKKLFDQQVYEQQLAQLYMFILEDVNTYCPDAQILVYLPLTAFTRAQLDYVITFDCMCSLSFELLQTPQQWKQYCTDQFERDYSKFANYFVHHKAEQKTDISELTIIEKALVQKLM